MSKEIKQNLKAPCNACPFRKNSLGGYLGGVWTALDLHKYVMGEQVFACHKTIDEDNQPMPELELCVGSVMYMNNNAKMCRDSFLAKAQKTFKGQDTSNILSVPEFMEHHKTAKMTDEPYQTITTNKSTTIMERTQEEINKEISKLEQLKKIIPQTGGVSGNDNHKVIEYQIAVLKGEYADESEIEEITGYEDEEDADEKELNQFEATDVKEAFGFLDGSIDELVSEEELKRWSKE